MRRLTNAAKTAGKFSEEIARCLTSATRTGGLRLRELLTYLKNPAVQAVSAIVLGVVGNFAYDAIKPQQEKSEPKLAPASRNNPPDAPASHGLSGDNNVKLLAVEESTQASGAPLLPKASVQLPPPTHQTNGVQTTTKKLNQEANDRNNPTLPSPTSQKPGLEVPILPIPITRPELPRAASPKPLPTDQLSDWLAGPLFSFSGPFTNQPSMWIAKEGERLIAHFNDDGDLRCEIKFDSSGDPQALSGCRYFYPTAANITVDSSILKCSYYKEKIVCNGQIRISNGVQNYPHDLTIARPIK